jgi:hypothetical protein
MKKIILAALLLPLTALAAGGSEGTGGGDLCEARIQAIRNDIVDWISRGGHEGLKLSGLDVGTYKSRMKLVAQTARIVCVNPGDKGYPVEVDGVAKECRFDKRESRSLITCDTRKFQGRSESDQYVLVHHEYAGLAGIEKPKGDISDYSISSQISSYLVDTVVKKLSVKKSAFGSREDSSVIEPNDPRFTYAMAEAAFKSGSQLEPNELLGDWFGIGVAVVPHAQGGLADFKGSYYPDGISRELRSGPKKYPLVFRLDQDAFGARVVTVSSERVDLNTGKSESKAGPFQVSFGRDQIAFEEPASSRRCHSREICKAVSGGRLLCGTFHADEANPCLAPIPKDKTRPFKYSLYKKAE